MGVEFVRLNKRIALMLAIVMTIAALPAPISTSAMPLASGSHVRWIDRIAQLPDYAKEFYSWLEANAHLDGALADPAKAQKNGTDYVYVLDVITGSVNAGKDVSSGTIQNAILDHVGNMPQTVSDYAFEIYGAFDRDHPEVFWLTGQSQCGMSLTYSYNPQSGIANYELTVMFYLLTAGFDIRLQEYQNRSTLSDAINKRDMDVQRILSGVPAGASVAEQVRYFNRVLTQLNSYNASVSVGGTAPAHAWKCTSALAGSVGNSGPVCEGYARAFKVLCDRMNIPCVLTEGMARNSTTASAELHMWNYVQVDGSWYAVDVTWNDPRSIGAGNAALSGFENEIYLLVGSNTPNSAGQSFAATHLVRNCVIENGQQYTNGPQLSASAYLIDHSDPTPKPDPTPEPDPKPDPEPEPDPKPQATLVAQRMLIDAYRTGGNTAPHLDGYVFVGWFLDPELTQPLSKQTNSGYAYAAFAQEQMMSVKCQLSAGTMAGSSATNLRLLTGVCTMKPEAVVFFVGDEAFAADGLYTRLQYEGTTAEQLFGSAATHIASYTIENIPWERFDDTFSVVPGWYTWDGTLVVGTPRTVCVSDGL